ncbi:hypothetical protein [Streptomyces sp. NPDC005538]|uniref:hypothetical protein n=1 Tax=unclassified Streptomyces TaxID=2593676 RepID=UPI00339F3081
MRHSRGSARTAAQAAAVVVVAVLMSGCSSGDPAQAKEWQGLYCAKLGAWEKAKRASVASTAAAGDGEDTGYDIVASKGRAAINASKRLDREGLNHGGTKILDDTVNAIGGDAGAEGRAVSYCDSAGFEGSVG